LPLDRNRVIVSSTLEFVINSHFPAHSIFPLSFLLILSFCFFIFLFLPFHSSFFCNRDYSIETSNNQQKKLSSPLIWAENWCFEPG
jgi:hypothetical protein